MNEKIIDIINTLKPYLQYDGGDISFIKYENNTVYVKLQGGCAGCDFADETLQNFVLTTLQSEIPEIKNIINVSQ